MKRKLFLYFSLFTFHFSVLSAQQGTWFWGKNGVGDVAVQSIASDTKGNCYLTGLFGLDTIHFGSYTLMDTAINLPPSNTTEVDAFLVKYDRNGNVLWAKQTFAKSSSTSFQNNAPTSVCTNNFGNIYWAGNFVDTLFIGSSTLITNPKLSSVGLTQNTYLAKYDQNGNVLWAKQAICVNDSGLINEDGISCDNLGNIYVTGIYGDTISFGGHIISTPTAYYTNNMFLVKYDSNGNAKWAVCSKGKHGGEAQGFAVSNDRNGNTFVTGGFIDTVKFGSYTLSTLQSSAFYIAKYDSNGNTLWAKQAKVPSSYSTGVGFSSVTDQTGNIYIAGNFLDTLIFNQDTLIGPGYSYQYSFFLVKYDPNGNFLWVKQAKVKDNNNWEIGGLSIDNSNHLYLSTGGGQGTNAVIFAGDTITMNDTAEYDGASVIFKLDSNGNSVCYSIIPIGTDGGFYPPVASDTSGNYVYLGGIAQGIDVFGKDTVNPFTYPTGHPYAINGCAFVARWEECDSNVLYAGVSEVKAESEKIKVYPNPNSGLFTIECNTPVNGTIEVYDITGRKVYQQTIQAEKTEIDIGNQSAGMYFYRAITNKGSLIGDGKIIIQK